jgi:hypothetical protein
MATCVADSESCSCCSSCLHLFYLLHPCPTQRHPFFSHFRVLGANQRIPMPGGFPPPRVKSIVTPTGAPLDSARSAKDARRAEEVERKNEVHMLEQVCALIVGRGMSARTKALDASISSVPMGPMPIDARLCERICARLATVLQVAPASVRTILVRAHNKHVGIAE